MTCERRDVGAVGDECGSDGETGAEPGGGCRNPADTDAAAAQQRPLGGADSGAGDDSAKDGGRHRIDPSGDEMADLAGHGKGEGDEQPAPPRSERPACRVLVERVNRCWWRW